MATNPGGPADQVGALNEPQVSGVAASAAELEDALNAAQLPQDEREIVEKALLRDAPPDPDEVLGGHAEDSVLDAEDPDEQLGHSEEAAESTSEMDSVIAEAEASAQDALEIPQEVLEALAAEARGAEHQEPVPVPAPEPEVAVSQDVLDSLLEEMEQTPKPSTSKKPASPRPSAKGVDAPKEVRVRSSASIRLIAAILAGLVTGIAVFYQLSTNRLRALTADDIAAAMGEGDLESAIHHAEGLMADGRYSEAARRLEDALEVAPMGPLKVDAEFLLLSAIGELIPERIEAGVAAEYHGMVDRLIELAPLHPHAARALFVNARVYEAEANELAARALYREIVRDYSDAEAAPEILLAAGQLELELNQPVQAADYFDRLIANFPGSELVERARLHIGDALQMAGNYDGARVTFVRLAQAYPGTPLGDEAFERLGQLAFETGDYESAIRELESRLISATSIEGNDRIYLLLAKTYSASGKPEKAVELLRELLEFFPESDTTPLAYVELSRVQSVMGLDREAARTATQAVDRYPRHAAVLRNAGDMLARTERYAGAASSYEDAYHAGETDPELMLEAGRLYIQAELYASAEAALQTVETEHATTPSALEAAIEWSRLKFKQGEVTVAFDRLESLAEVTRDRPQQLQIKSALATLYEEIGFATEAQRLYAEIPELTSEPSLLAGSAKALFASGDVEGGLDVAERVEIARLSDAEAYGFLVAAGTALFAGDLRSALDTLETAHQNYPLQRTVEGDAALLRANIAAGRAARARAVMAEMRQRFEDAADAAKTLTASATEYGDYLYDRGDYRAAAEAYTYAIPSDASGAMEADTWAVYQRANALYKMADFEESLALYEQVAQTKSPWAADAESKIDALLLDMRLRGMTLPETRNAG